MGLGRLRRSTRRLALDERGQDLVELVMVTPLLLLFVFGIIEFGSILDSQQAVSYLAREGANIASRGTALDTVLAVTMRNGEDIQLDTRGGAVVSRVFVASSVPHVAQQFASAGYGSASHVGGVGDEVTNLEGLNLSDGASVYVVEVFYHRADLTPFTGLFTGTLPDVLYERAVF